MKSKKAQVEKNIMEIIIWVIVFAIAVFGIIFLFKKFG